jgi:hypothetical protein
MMRGFRMSGLLLALGVSVHEVAVGQDTCRVLAQLGDRGTRQVLCGTDTLLAITRTQQEASVIAAKQLATERAVSALKDSVLATHAQERALQDSTIARKNAYIAELERLWQDYKRLAQDYKRAKRESWFSAEVGIGATDDSEPAVLAGIGFRRIRVWGFLQESNAGGIVGVQLPLF